MRAQNLTLSEKERLSRLRLARSENVGPITFRQLLHRFGTAEAALDALPALARRGGRKSIKIATIADVESEWAALIKLGGVFLFDGEAAYSHRLSMIEDAPPVLCAIGHPGLLSKPCLAVVGGRNASIHGRSFASEMARTLGENDFAVASGMARGIDAAAHAGAMETGTIAVLAGGADVVYPTENAALYDQLIEQGLVLSEMPVGVHPKARHFPRRNRIISGLSLGVVVVEARRKSGSLITARYAADQGRDVFAVPGFPQDPRAQGGNDLIRTGATLVQSAEDVLLELENRVISEPDAPSWSDPPAAVDNREIDRIRAEIVEGLNAVPLPLDTLLRSIDASPGAVQLALLELELAGIVERHSGNRVSNIPKMSD